MIKRRSFLGYFSIGWLTACFPVVLAACAPTKSASQATTKVDDPDADDRVNDKGAAKPIAKKTVEGFTVLGSVAQLEKAGYLQIKGIAVSRNSANSKQPIAVNTTCTHIGCEVKWSAGEKRYECPCHDAEFAADGKVLRGPASSPLATYPVKIVGTQVLVKV